MTQQSMTEAELKDFLTALSDNCGNKKKIEWYHGLIDDIGIAFTSNNTPDASETINKAKSLYQNGKKLEAVKLIIKLGYNLKDAKNYCDENFWLLSNSNEVRGNESLEEKFKTILPMGMPSILNNCIKIAKQYSDSKLSELEKWIDEQFKHADSLDKQDDTVTRYFAGKKDGLSLMKIKLQSLK